MVGEMRNRSDHTVRRCSLTSLLLASLALLPSFGWAGREDPRAGRDGSGQRPQASTLGRQMPLQPAAPSRPSAPQRQASGKLPSASVAAPPAARIDRGNVAAPMPSLLRGVSAPSQVLARRADALQTYRQPDAADLSAPSWAGRPAYHQAGAAAEQSPQPSHPPADPGPRPARAGQPRPEWAAPGARASEHGARPPAQDEPGRVLAPRRRLRRGSLRWCRRLRSAEAHPHRCRRWFGSRRAGRTRSLTMVPP